LNNIVITNNPINESTNNPINQITNYVIFKESASIKKTIMKKYLLYFLSILFVASLLGSCAAARNIGADTTLQKKWNLIFIDSVSTEKVIASEGYIDFTVAGKGGAKAGCNQMFFTYEVLKGNKINISQIGSTMMMCPEMEPEMQMSKALPDVNRYSIVNDTLILQAGDRVLFRGI